MLSVISEILEKKETMLKDFSALKFKKIAKLKKGS